MAPDLKRRILDSSSYVTAAKNALWLIGGASAGIAYAFTRDRSFGVLLTAGILLLLTAATAATVTLRKFRRLRAEMAEHEQEFEEQLDALKTASETFRAEAVIAEKAARDLADTPFGYRIRGVKYSYTFDAVDYSKHSQECNTEIEATRSGVNLFEARYRWSGSGNSQFKLLTPRQILLTHPGMQLRHSNYYYVFLKVPLMLGDTDRICVQQEVIDRDRTMVFQLTKTVREPIESLTLSVTFPPDGPGRSDVWAVSRKSKHDDSQLIERFPFDWDDGQRRASLRIEQPERGVTYAIEWYWDGYRLDGLPVKPRRSEEGIERTTGRPTMFND